MANLLPLADGEVISTVLPLPEDEAEWGKLHILFATANGLVRRNAMDAFTNVYPESSFVCEPFMITSGLANPDPLKAAFVTMALSIGISMMKADVFDPKIREAFFAAQALLDEGDGLKGYQESLK